ncbi:MAG: S8 family serine peptidase, partial [Acidimicrobiaceae bacterium]|nr:S8 family serine peptidase [Acidimicrobiaceae bacterium]MYE77116.1 S8 family serine peptidase [Acidimicrobiaceae bacterium]MYJ42592.1 S8 family serine peptidase [Acidimicrobiaceae bacterium]
MPGRGSRRRSPSGASTGPPNSEATDALHRPPTAAARPDTATPGPLDNARGLRRRPRRSKALKLPFAALAAATAAALAAALATDLNGSLDDAAAAVPPPLEDHGAAASDPGAPSAQPAPKPAARPADHGAAASDPPPPKRSERLGLSRQRRAPSPASPAVLATRVPQTDRGDGGDGSTAATAGALATNAPLLHRGDVGVSCRAFEAWLSDELSGCLWHLDRARSFDGRLGATPAGGEINIGGAWTATRGANVNVAVLDERWNPDHHDIVDNVDLARSVDYTGVQTGEGRTGHGTAVAGVIAARDNDVGGRGVAPRATLFNYNVVESPASLSDALKRNASLVAVYNGSFGGSERPPYQRVSAEVWKALEHGRVSGFGGLGSLYVFSAGNGRTADSGSGQVNTEERHAHPAALAVCAVDDDGTHAAYSNIGSSLWVCAPSEGDAEDDDNHLLAPAGDNDYRVLGRTSAAAPQVSGVIALVRSVNPYLGWRDVKLILAGTAQKNDPSHSGWHAGSPAYGSSGRRYHFNHLYGFGVVDASSAVDAALGWKRLPAERVETVASGEIRVPTQFVPEGLPLKVPNDGTVVEHSLEVPAGTAIDFVEHLSVTLDVTSNFGRDLLIEIVSPGGTTSTLIEPIGRRDQCYGSVINGHYFPECGVPRRLHGRPDGVSFASNAFLGEDPAGTWTLRLSDSLYEAAPRRPRDSVPFEDVYRTTVNSWDLKLRGHSGASADSAPRARLSVSGASGLEATADEGAVVVVVASLADGVAGRDYTLPVSVVDGDATHGDGDFARSELSITVPRGRRSGTATLSITADGIDETDETFSLAWRDQSQGTGPDSLMYLGDPVEVTIPGNVAPEPLLRARLSVDSACVAEGASVTVTVDLLGGTHSREVRLPVEFVGGTARVAGDRRGRIDVYPLAVDGALETQLRVAAGQTRASGIVQTAGDREVEDDETFDIVVQRPAGLTGVLTVTGSPVTVTIVDDDSGTPRPCPDAGTTAITPPPA